MRVPSQNQKNHIKETVLALRPGSLGSDIQDRGLFVLAFGVPLHSGGTQGTEWDAED